MLFNSWIYAFFLAAVLLAYWSTPGPQARRLLLTVAGAVFYAYYFPPHLVLILVLTLAVYGTSALARRVRLPARALGLAVMAWACIGVLAYYKYTGFLLGSLQALGWPAAAVPTPTIRAPLAVSFFIFEYVHYLIEVRRGTIRPTGVGDFLLFILFFPTLICGPIKRYGDFEPQIATVRLASREFAAGLVRIVNGLAKKIVADNVAGWIAPIWSAPDTHGTVALWLGTYGYAMQIYLDFAGYSDIAIGSSQLLGYHVPENFNAPYLRANIAEFWQSWHMSLTSWIRDYVYIPLGGNRRGLWRAHANRLAAMTLCGLWHGAGWHFAAWGLYHGIGLVVQRGYHQLRAHLQPGWRPAHTPLARILATIVTFHFVCIGWVLFVLDFGAAARMIARLLGLP